jgi:dienelactone hydrolase
VTGSRVDVGEAMDSLAIHIDNAHRFHLDQDGISYPYFRDGSGPGVLVLHELPGLTPKCIELADRIMRQGYTVYLPLFFGDPFEDSGMLGFAHITRMCIRHELECFATDKTSHLSHWLRALCVRMHAECGGPGVGAIGMCLTGGIILSVMIEESLLVPVVCQPVMPLYQVPLPGGPSEEARKSALGIDPHELEFVKERAVKSPILGYRFTTDTLCPPERFARLRKEFGDNFRGTEIPTGPEHPGKIRNKAHSVLTTEFVDEEHHPTRRALDEILQRFRERLKV